MTSILVSGSERINRDRTEWRKLNHTSLRLNSIEQRYF